MSAALAYADSPRLVDDPLLFMAEDLEDQGWQSENQPFDRDPPPADKEPPKEPVMRVLQLGFVDHLNIYRLTSAFRANHFVTTFRYKNLQNYLFHFESYHAPLHSRKQIRLLFSSGRKTAIVVSDKEVRP